MGQIITSNEMRHVIDENLHQYIEQNTTNYARLFQKSPTFVTYYQQDINNSMMDVNLGGAIQLIGPESPIKYKIIHDFPIYGVSEIDFTSTFNELKGIVNESIKGTAYILPNTIRPGENDFFTVDYFTTKILFRIITTNSNHLEGNAYFSIDYILDQTNPDFLTRQLTTSHVFELKNVGTSYIPIIEEDIAILLRQMEVIEEQHRLSYWKAFYNRSSGALLLRDTFQYAIHDRSIDIFINKYNLLKGNGYHGSRIVYIHEYYDLGKYTDSVYSKTLYWYSEKGDLSAESYAINGLTFSLLSPVEPSNPFFNEFALTNYCEATLDPNDAEYYIGGNDFIFKILEKDFLSGSHLNQLARKCLSKDGFSTDPRDALREFIEFINQTSILDDRSQQFWLMPFIFMRANKFRDKSWLNI
jgi:hypothetical protein